MSIDTREVIGSPKPQGRNERVAYVFDFTARGTPTSPTVTLRNSLDADVTSTNLLGAATVNGYKVTTPLVISLNVGEEYKLYVQVTCSGNVVEPYLRIQGEA